RRARAASPDAHICFYGLYAGLNARYLLGQESPGDSAKGTASSRPIADSVIAGEVEAPLAALARALAEGRPPEDVPGVSTRVESTAAAAPGYLARLDFPVPDRQGLPSLDNYARFMHEGRAVPAGYVEASRGCLHTCRHCPVVPVYGGRFFVAPVETVMADVRQQVAAGACHITFGDPDFLNGPGHALKVARALHAEFPGVTFDFTTKVEHILERAELFPQFRRLGAAFVVSAFEAVDDAILAHLHKGHTAADMARALDILRAAELPVQPTWLPFTPWTTLDGYIELLSWIRARGLIPHVPAVQLSIRLLIPPGSALLEEHAAAGWLGPLDAGNFSYRWEHPDPRVDALQARVAALAERASDDSPYTTFRAVEQLAHEAAGRAAPVWQPPADSAGRLAVRPPRLTEDWFC
ncbi:MAG: CUAEP/CCAEP-tail radical SAM protein, partial [Candidatus Promineifilaceae bacterium]|nr:CUAEP/CCAEP-tail radical SAM protein [Candidatus Promineifilaceae bacterium]